MLTIPTDVIVLFGHNDSYILYNAFTKNSLALDHDGLDVLKLLVNGHSSSKECLTWDTEWFSSVEGLLADPTRIIRDVEKWPNAEVTDSESLRDKLIKKCILIEDVAEYESRFANKNGLLDYTNFGNFHQQLGQHLMVTQRVNPAEWWYKQKFTSDLCGIKNNLYKSVQEKYLESYFKKRLTPSSTIVDVGCGLGFYSRMMANFNNDVNVIGLDPNSSYIETANINTLPNLQFVNADIGTSGGLDSIESNKADFVFMSDALLFYFIPERPNQKGDLGILMRDIWRILKSDGVFISLEPHPAFFLNPWLGSPTRPFTILTEYRNRNFSIVPSLSTLIQGVISYGFVVSFLDELYSAQSDNIDQRAHGFAKEFPIWQLLEFSKVDK